MKLHCRDIAVLDSRLKGRLYIEIKVLMKILQPNWEEI
jgi:hypothetical protein